MVTRCAAADFLQRPHQPLAGDAQILEDLLVGRGQQHVLDRNVVVLEALGFVLGRGQQAPAAAW